MRVQSLSKLAGQEKNTKWFRFFLTEEGEDIVRSIGSLTKDVGFVAGLKLASDTMLEVFSSGVLDEENQTSQFKDLFTSNKSIPDTPYALFVGENTKGCFPYEILLSRDLVSNINILTKIEDNNDVEKVIGDLFYFTFLLFGEMNKGKMEFGSRFH